MRKVRCPFPPEDPAQYLSFYASEIPGHMAAASKCAKTIGSCSTQGTCAVQCCRWLCHLLLLLQLSERDGEDVIHILQAQHIGQALRGHPLNKVQVAGCGLSKKVNLQQAERYGCLHRTPVCIRDSIGTLQKKHTSASSSSTGSTIPTCVSNVSSSSPALSVLLVSAVTLSAA